MKTAVIGGGPAGLMAAYSAAKHGSQVTLFERNGACGRKLLLSGSGQCNITHDGDIDDFLSKFGDKSRFLLPSFHSFFVPELFSLLKKYIPVFEKTDEGKYFPKSRMAVDVLNAFLSLNSSCEIKANITISSAEYDNSFYLRSCENKYGPFDSLIVSCGGMSFPKTGSDGKGYALARNFGHKIITPKPALTDVNIRDFQLSSCKGLSFKNIELTLLKKEGGSSLYTGDLLITHRGFSGPVILNNSRFFSSGDILVPDFGDLQKGFNQNISEYCSRNGKKKIKSFFRENGFPDTLIQQLLLSFPELLSKNLGELSKNDRKIIEAEVVNRKYEISSLGDFKRAMITAGGVCLKEVNRKTMESRLQKGLFFAGEVLDIDGDTGGYNLQAAFSTGYLAGIHAVEIRK